MVINRVEWGNWGLTFYASAIDSTLATMFFATLPFPVGPQGPTDGTLGSPLRQRYLDACKQWQNGECPMGAVCWLDQRWLYVPRIPA